MIKYLKHVQYIQYIWATPMHSLYNGKAYTNSSCHYQTTAPCILHFLLHFYFSPFRNSGHLPSSHCAMCSGAVKDRHTYMHVHIIESWNTQDIQHVEQKITVQTCGSVSWIFNYSAFCMRMTVRKLLMNQETPDSFSCLWKHMPSTHGPLEEQLSVCLRLCDIHLSFYYQLTK